MAWKHLTQPSLADDLVAEHEALTALDDIKALIDWSSVETLLEGIHSSRRGEKAWPPLMMFQALLLQSWYQLSDPALERQFARDLLFRRFVDLSLSESVPDHSTFWRFRNLLQKQDLLEPLLAEINDQLAMQGAVIRDGEASIIDASVIKAQRNRSNKGCDGNNTQDPEAAYNVKNGADGKRQTTDGFKVHANVDEDGFIKRYDYTAGNVHDSQVFEDLLTGTEHEVYADSAYKSQAHDDLLEHKGIKNRVLEKGYRNRPLTDKQKRNNRLNASARSVVERVFGVLKLHYDMAQARYLGQARNKARFGLMAIAYNMKRAANLLKPARGITG